MIDLHSHILPDLDDGPDSMERALRMARLAVLDGVQVVAATPHYNNGLYQVEKPIIVESVASFNQMLRENEIPLTVVPGQELHFNGRMTDDLFDRDKVATLNGSKYVLVEFPPDEVPGQTEEFFHELAVMGLVPVIAHPERNREISQHPDLLADLIHLGALSQVTSQSLAGKFGSRLQQLTLELCRRNLAHIVASDAHNESSRPFLMTEALETVRSELGPEYQSYYLSNAGCICNNYEIEIMPPVHVQKRKLFFWKR